MSSLNKVQLIGRLGKDPEVRHLDSGMTVSNFSIATSESYTNKQGEKVEQTEWHAIVAWGKLAEIIEKWVTKGMLIYIEGKLKTRKWEKDGQTHYATEIFADSMQMLSKSEPKEQSQPVQQNSDSLPKQGDDYVPF